MIDQGELLPHGAGAPPVPRPVSAATLTLRTIDLPLPGGRLLRVGLTFDADGHPEDLEGR